MQCIWEILHYKKMKILYDHQIFINQVYGGPSRYFIKLVNEISKSEDVKIGAALHINSHLSEITKDKVKKP